MNIRKFLLIPLIATIIVGCTISPTCVIPSPASVTPSPANVNVIRQKWEYKIYNLSCDVGRQPLPNELVCFSMLQPEIISTPLNKLLKDMGDNGWELISVIYAPYTL